MERAFPKLPACAGALCGILVKCFAPNAMRAIFRRDDTTRTNMSPMRIPALQHHLPEATGTAQFKIARDHIGNTIVNKRNNMAPKISRAEYIKLLAQSKRTELEQEKLAPSTMA